MPSLAPGTPFGRYRLWRKLAAGGMAEVYLGELATAAGVTKEVVIKKIHPHLADDGDFRAMFIDEARIAASLSHGNIAQVFDFGEVEGELFLAMEYVAGRSVSDLLKRAREQGRRLPAEHAAFIAQQMCQGLHYAHSRVDAERRPLNLVHRDVSPQNVLVGYEGQVKIVDFGIAKAYGEGGPTERSQTASGVVKGKYLYFSPEQACAQPLDAATDVYATGVVLYEMLCGRAPFEGTMAPVLVKLLQGDFPRPRQVSADLPAPLEAIVLRAMATERGHRFASARAMQEALADFLGAHAPRMGQAALADLVLDLFPDGAEGASTSAPSTGPTRTPPALTDPLPATRSDKVAASKPRATGPVLTQMAAADPPVAPKRTLAIALGGGGLLLGAVALAIGVHVASGGETQAAPSVIVAAPIPVAAPSPVRAPPSPVPTPAAPPPLPDHWAGLAPLAKAAHGGRVVPGLRCDQDPRLPEVQRVAAQATQVSTDSRYNEASALLLQAIGAEPTAGNLYVSLADDATASLDPTHLDLILRDLESFEAACPTTRHALLDNAYQRLSDIVDPEGAAARRPKGDGEYVEVPASEDLDVGEASPTKLDSATRRKAAALRADAEGLIRRGLYDEAQVKLHAALRLNPSDPKARRLLDVCVAQGAPETWQAQGAKGNR